MGAEPVRPGGGPSELGRPCGENPGIMRKAVFSEGCALRVRVARPYVRRGIPFPPHALRMSQWPRGGNVGVGVMPSLRACGARPSAGLVIRAGMALRGNPGITPGAVFSEGRGLRARVARPYARRDIFIFTPCVDDDPVAKGRQRWGWPYADVMGVRSRPSAGGLA